MGYYIARYATNVAKNGYLYTNIIRVEEGKDMKESKMYKKYGPWAVITGATGGIGAEFANQLAGEGINIVLVARNEKNLSVKAKEIETKFGVKAKMVQADLSNQEGINKVIDATSDLDVGLLIPNAGMENNGYFVDVNFQSALKEIQINVTSVFALTHHFSNKMVKKSRGGIILVSSMLGHMATPYFSNYSGTKAYVLMLGTSLYSELKSNGVDITVLSPGLTNTAMAKSVKSKYNLPMPTMSPVYTAGVAIKALGRKPVVIPGVINNMMMVTMNKLLSVPAAIKSASMMMEFSKIK